MLIANWISTLFCFVLLSTLNHGSAFAGELAIFATVAMKPALSELVPRFEKIASSKVLLSYTGGADLKQRVDRDEQFDILIALKPSTEALLKSGAILPDHQSLVGSARASLAYRTGTAAPDISTEEAFKSLMLSAPSISVSDPTLGGASATYFMSVLKRLGLESDVKSKLVLTKIGEGAAPVGNGSAPYGVALTSEIAGVAGVSGVPIFGSDSTGLTVVFASISSHAHDPELSRQFIDFMLSPEATTIRKVKGLTVD